MKHLLWIVDHIEIVGVLTTVFFLLPIVVIGIRKSMFKSFDMAIIIKTLNIGFLFQIGIGIIITITSYFLDASSFKGVSRDILIGTAYTYSVIGIFIYLPALLVVNLIYWSVRKLTKQNQ